MKKPFQHLLQRFKDDDSASLTMEFVLMLPVLMLWFIGSIVFFNAYITKSGAQRAAHTVSDVISRQTQVDNNFIDTLLLLQNRMLPRARVGTVRVSSIQKNANTGDLAMLWTYSTDANAQPLLINDIPLTDLPLMQAGESVLLVDTSVPFAPISDWVAMGSNDWTNRVVVTTRFVDPLVNTDFP